MTEPALGLQRQPCAYSTEGNIVLTCHPTALSHVRAMLTYTLSMSTLS